MLALRINSRLIVLLILDENRFVWCVESHKTHRIREQKRKRVRWAWVQAKDIWYQIISMETIRETERVSKEMCSLILEISESTTAYRTVAATATALPLPFASILDNSLCQSRFFFAIELHHPTIIPPLFIYYMWFVDGNSTNQINRVMMSRHIFYAPHEKKREWQELASPKTHTEYSMRA